ncbi:hypothetical protein M918_03240 [Clostridium sp. BL8]|nr:hypothetical protein M918_03240 [Clostridium sp. BL8]
MNIKSGRGFKLYVPMSFARFGMRIGIWGVRRSKNTNEEVKKYLNIIDERVISQALRELSNKYKGLDLVHIQSKGGEVIKITV